MCASKTARVEKVCELSLYAVTCLSASLRVYWEAYSRTSGHALAAFDHDNQDFITCEVGFGLPVAGSLSQVACPAPPRVTASADVVTLLHT